MTTVLLLLILLAGYPLSGNHQCVCELYEISDTNLNYYQPGSNAIIVVLYGKHITHARTHARTHAHTHARTHARTYVRTHARTHARTHSRTHARTHVHIRTHSRPRTHPPTHRRRRRLGCRCSMGRSAPNHDEVNAPFTPVPLAMDGQSVLHSNKQSRMRRGIRDSFECFRV